MSSEVNENLESLLSREDRDTIAELGNIAMGAAGSTLGVLLGYDIEITTQSVVEYANLAEMDIPFGEESKTLVLVTYTKGVKASSLFIIRNTDARRLADMMMGAPGDNPPDKLNDLQLGAVSELMNQMMNAAATGLASVLQKPVEIGNPDVIEYSSDNLAACLPQVLAEPFLACTMVMKLGEEAPIELIELRVATEAQSLVAQFVSGESGSDAPSGSTGKTQSIDLDELIRPEPAPAGIGGRPAQQAAIDPVTVRPVQFASFDHQPNVYGEENKNLELVMDVTLNLTVELGKTELSIKDVLELTRGSVIELDRVAGEPVDLMANGKLIAKGEVVVIEDNFGLRITSIVSPADRLRGL